jgi:hypothetical protein
MNLISKIMASADLDKLDDERDNSLILASDKFK